MGSDGATALKCLEYRQRLISLSATLLSCAIQLVQAEICTRITAHSLVNVLIKCGINIVRAVTIVLHVDGLAVVETEASREAYLRLNCFC